jgi:hypothetical protein
MATPIAPATPHPAVEDASEAGLTAAERRALRNLFKVAQQAIDSPARTRISERAILLALVERAEAVLNGVPGHVDEERADG